MSKRGRQRERERGKGIYRKMGLRSTFSCKEPIRDQVSVSQFRDHRSAIGFALRLDRLPPLYNGEPDSETLSSGLRLLSCRALVLRLRTEGGLAHITYRCDLFGALDFQRA